MITLNRTKEEKWIIQKNISSNEIMKNFVEILSNQDEIDKSDLKDNLSKSGIYKGRSKNGSLSTMGVRFSQMCFYMFGYKKDKKFIPSATTQMLLSKKYNDNELMLVNLFCMQFPSPYSETSSNFQIYFGRLILKLLTEANLQNRLYIDECIWFLPFIKNITPNLYNELINSILESMKM